MCLLKHVFAKIDYQAEIFSLKYLQTKEHHEVDFALVCNDKIEKIIEVKHANHSIDAGLRYFHDKYQFPALQVVKELKQEKMESGIEIMHGHKFLKNLVL